jgi:hypothetical protein
MMTHLPTGFVIHSFAELAALQCEDHIRGAQNSEPAVEAGRRIEVAGVGAGREAGVLSRPGSQGGDGRRAEIFY